MNIVLQLDEEQLGKLVAHVEKMAGKSYMQEDLSEGKFFEGLLQQLEREKFSR